MFSVGLVLFMKQNYPPNKSHEKVCGCCTFGSTGVLTPINDRNEMGIWGYNPSKWSEITLLRVIPTMTCWVEVVR